MALKNGIALIGSAWDDDYGNNSGSASLFRPLASPLTPHPSPLTPHPSPISTAPLPRAASPPGALGAAFQSFPSAYINPNGVVVLRANLSGPGAKQGVWDSFPGSSTLALRVKASVGNYQISKIHSAWSNHNGDAVILTNSTLQGYPSNKITASRHSAANSNSIGGSFLYNKAVEVLNGVP